MMQPRRFPPVYAPVSGAHIAGALAAQLVPAAAGRLARYTSAARAALEACVPARELLLTDSGTTALALALQLASRLVVSPRVALPAYCCPDVATAAIANDMPIVLYDVHPHTLHPDWDSVLTCLEQGATILVVTHLFGRLVDVPAAQSLAERFGAVVVEDAAQGAGGTWNGRPAASLAPLSIMSFGRGKGINAGGGGALLVDACVVQRGEWPLPTLAPVPRGRSLAALTKAAVSELLSSPWLYGIPAAVPALGIGDTVYHAPTIPRAMSLSSAQLLPSALARQPQLAAQRRAVEAEYEAQLGHVSGLLLAHAHASCTSGALRMPVQLSPQQGAALRRHGVARSYPRTLAAYAEVQPHLQALGALPGAEALASGLHTLPTHHLLSANDRTRLVQALIRMAE